MYIIIYVYNMYIICIVIIIYMNILRYIRSTYANKVLSTDFNLKIAYILYIKRMFYLL